ncbi:VQ motif-containing protein 10-like [Silene latifolia]|uniref:VQ motif-containing protein 10-like n=1 Tax=Silene latifolia TaxID=37657 RepID=UPI003D7887FE
MSRRGENQPMKVVHIKTQYVETDATSFKSVVQNLTGKDSTIAESPPRNYSSSSMAMNVKKRDQNNHHVLDRNGGGSLKFLARDLSFGRMLKEFPSIEELNKILTFD